MLIYQKDETPDYANASEIAATSAAKVRTWFQNVQLTSTDNM
jgi:hypothetical protein